MLLDEWLTALRSGEWQQGKDALATVALDADGGETIAYCCLGVACELSDEVARMPFPTPGPDNQPVYTYYCMTDGVVTGDEQVVLPWPVQQALGLRTPSGEFEIDDTLPEALREKVMTVGHNKSPGTWSPITHFYGRRMTTLAKLNDAGASFALIADIISARPTGLFGIVDAPTS